MNVGDSLIVVSQILQLSNSVYQVKYNKLKKSIYGISYDYYVLSTIHKVLSIIVSLNYVLDSTAILQYRLRYPVHPHAVISPLIIVIDSGSIVANSLILFQLFIVYRRTKNVNQNISEVNKLFLFIISGGFLVVFKYFWFAQLTINYLDLINYVWVASWLISLVELCPQIVMNWFDNCCVGLHPQWIVLEQVSLATNILGWLTITHHYHTPWYDLAINYHGWCYLIMRTGFVMIFSFQQFKWYKGNRPTLELYHYHDVASVIEDDMTEQV